MVPCYNTTIAYLHHRYNMNLLQNKTLATQIMVPSYNTTIAYPLKGILRCIVFHDDNPTRISSNHNEI